MLISRLPVFHHLGGGGGKLTDHVAIRPRRGEGRLHNYNYWQYLGGGGGGGGGGVGSVGGGGGGGERS